MTRSRNYLIAAALAGVLALANTIVALILIPQGSDKIDHSSNQPPYAVLIIEVVIGLIGMVAAYGVFRTQRWGIVVTLVLSVVNLLVSLPGIPFGPTVLDQVTSAAAAVVSLVIMWLLLRRDTRVEVKAELGA